MSTPQDAVAALAAMLAGRGVGQQGPSVTPPPALALSTDTKVQLLKQRYEEIRNPHKFEAGQLVKWKVGMQTRPFPAMGDPAIVIEILDPPVFDGTSDASFAAFREPLNLVVGCLGPQGQLLVFHLPGFRLEPF